MATVLVGCEFSAVVRDAFRALGHDAWSCDFEACEGDDQYHLRGDIREYLDLWWDLGIFHPPCTYLCNSGVRWLKTEAGRMDKMREAAEFFKLCLNAPIKKVCVENPVMHGYAQKIVGVPFTQSIQPWQFGHPEIKRTCLWLRGLPPLTPTNIVEGREARVHRASPGPDRWKERSRTLPGVAKAFAEQWGDLK